MLKQTLVLGLLTLSGLYSAHAQEVLTLEKALNTAFEHSPSLKQTQPRATSIESKSSGCFPEITIFIGCHSFQVYP